MEKNEQPQKTDDVVVDAPVETATVGGMQITPSRVVQPTVVPLAETYRLEVGADELLRIYLLSLRSETGDPFPDDAAKRLCRIIEISVPNLADHLKRLKLMNANGNVVYSTPYKEWVQELAEE